MMKKLFLLISIMLISLCLNSAEMIVQNLVVEDNPFDEGRGLIVRFDPLPPSARIIEYRVYRGINPDSLFFIGNIDVNPKTDLTGTEITFYDKDFRPFLSIDSPRKIRHERGYKPGSPIFREIPRDLSIVGPMFEHFETLILIPNKSFYRKTQKYVLENEEGKKELLGGLNIRDKEIILANVLPGKKYYYTVIAVDYKRKYHPHAEIAYGIPSDDMPEPATNFYAAWIEDEQKLTFEFDYPLFTDDIAQASIYMIDRVQIDEIARYKDYMAELDIWNRKSTIGDTLAIMPDAVENPGKLLATIPTSFPYTSLNFVEVKYIDENLQNEQDGSIIPFDINDTKAYLFYVTMDDYAGFQAVSELTIAGRAHTYNLPILPSFTVQDKPNDKGDAHDIVIGKPLAMLTRVDLRRGRHDVRRLSFAYSYSENPNIKIKSITFKFVDHNGNFIDSVTEHYISNTFNLRLPSEELFYEGFQAFISFNAPGTEIHDDTYLMQNIEFDEDLNMLRTGNLMMQVEQRRPAVDVVIGDHRYDQRGDAVGTVVYEDLLDYRYQIIKRSSYDRNFRLESKITPLINVFDDFIQYESYMFRGVAKYDISTNHILFDPIVDMGTDRETGDSILTNLFLEDFIEIIRQNIEEMENELIEDPENDGILEGIEFYKSIMENQTTHPLLSEINEINNQKTKNNQLMKLRADRRRTFEYYMVKTDNQALFTISEIYVDENGNQHFFPIPNWFNKTTVPMLIASIVFALIVFICYRLTRGGKDLYVRPIAGIEEIDNAIGRATEMGRPILFVPGLTSIDDVATLAGLSILGHITKKAAQYDTKILVPCSDYIVLPIAQQIVKESYSVAGRQDSYDVNDVFFVAGEQFAYVAGVNGIMIRQKTATNFYMGYFFAEALVMTETGSMTGAIQVAGTDAITQIPFFITTCDYTLIGEELYAASAYLSRDPKILGTLKSQDYTKLIIIVCIFVGTLLSTFNATGMINWFPAE